MMKKAAVGYDGFTLIEIVIAALVIAVLAIIAMPRFLDMRNDAIEKTEDYVVGSVREGVGLAHLDNTSKGIAPAYPEGLDKAALGQASSENVFFASVLAKGVDMLWEKTGAYLYKGPTGRSYVYDPTYGTFILYGGTYGGWVPPDQGNWPPPGGSIIYSSYVSAQGNSAFRASGGNFTIWAGSNAVAWIGTNQEPGALTLEFARPFGDGPGNDFSVTTGYECWGPNADTARFDFYMNDNLVTSFDTHLVGNKTLSFELPGEGVVANRVVITNTTPDSAGINNNETMEFRDASAGYSRD